MCSSSSFFDVQYDKILISSRCVSCVRSDLWYPYDLFSLIFVVHVVYVSNYLSGLIVTLFFFVGKSVVLLFIDTL